MSAVLLEAIKEQQDMIKLQKENINELTKRISQLEQK